MIPNAFLVVVCKPDVKIFVCRPMGSPEPSTISFAQLGGRLAVTQGWIYPAVDNPAEELLKRWSTDRRIPDFSGDFAFCCVDLRMRSVVFGRDFLGGIPLYWKITDSGCYISTSHKPIHDVCGSGDIDSRYAAFYQMLPNAGLNEPCTHVTPFKEHNRVLPGESWEYCVDSGTQCKRISNYWSHAFGKKVVSAEETFSILKDAVAKRLGNVPGAHFSGGIDSTGIACIASAASGRQIHGFAKKYKGFKHLVQEAKYIEAAARHAKGIQLHEYDASDDTRYDRLDEAPLYDEPNPGLAHVHPASQFWNFIAAHDVDSLLTGVGGDHLFDLPQHLLIRSKFMNGRIQAGWSLAGQFANRMQTNRWWIIKEALSSRERPRIANDQELADYHVPPWFNERYSKHHEMIAIARSWFPENLVQHPDLANRYALGLIRLQAGDVERWYFGVKDTIAKTHPFFDRSLVEHVACLDETGRYSDQKQKPMLLSMLKGLLPDLITNRTRKGHFGELNEFGYSKMYPKLKELIQNSDVSDEIINKRDLLHCLHRASCGACKSVSTIDRLNLSLSLIHWHSRLREWQSEVCLREEVLKTAWMEQGPEHVASV